MCSSPKPQTPAQAPAPPPEPAIAPVIGDASQNQMLITANAAGKKSLRVSRDTNIPGADGSMFIPTGG